METQPEKYGQTKKSFRDIDQGRQSSALTVNFSRTAKIAGSPRQIPLK